MTAQDRSMHRCRRGALHVPLALALALAMIAGFGTWGTLRRWRHLAELQIRLDRCTGETALALKRALNRIEAANLAMRATRAGVAVTALAPPAQAELRAGLLALARYQDLERARWQAKRLGWLAQRGCDRQRDIPAPLPAMGWERPAPDALGEQPLTWRPGTPRSLKIKLVHLPRAAAALVSEEGKGNLKSAGNGDWKARWVTSGL